MDLGDGRALQRAGKELQQLMVRIARRYVDRHKTVRRSHEHEAAWCWRELLEIEGRHAPEILASFYRVRDSRLLPAGMDRPVECFSLPRLPRMRSRKTASSPRRDGDLKTH